MSDPKHTSLDRSQTDRALSGLTVCLFGPMTRFGVFVAGTTVFLDQISKVWLLFILDIRSRGTVTLAPVLDLVLVWNRGISYGLFQQTTDLGRWVLLGLKGVAVILLAGWLARARSKLLAACLALIIGGAIGNAIDGVIYGAVIDFVLFHITTATWNFTWYVFNLADVAVVAGVAGLLYESMLRPRAVKVP